jgi:hypothetical protein
MYERQNGRLVWNINQMKATNGCNPKVKCNPTIKSDSEPLNLEKVFELDYVKEYKALWETTNTLLIENKNLKKALLNIALKL